MWVEHPFAWNTCMTALSVMCIEWYVQSLETDSNIWRFSMTSAIAKTWFSMWKNCSTTAWTWSYCEGAERSDPSWIRAGLAGLCHWKPVSIGELVNADSTKSFWDRIWFHGSSRCILVENTYLGGFSAGPNCQDGPAVVRGILDSGRSATIFVRLEYAGLLSVAFCRRKSRRCLTPIWLPCIHPSPWNGTS